MRYIYPALAALLALVGVVLPASSQLFFGSPAPQAPGARIDIGKLPLLFEPNAGQTDPSVRFTAHAAVGTLFFSRSEVTLAINPANSGENAPGAVEAGTEVVRMSFIGADPSVNIEQGETATGKVSYFLGSDPGQWHAGLPTYSGITYSGLYPGVDLRYSADNNRLKGTYIVSPGADPSRISWRYQVRNAECGMRSVDCDARPTVDDAGNLTVALDSALRTPHSALVETAPVAWQEIGGERVPVAAGYVVAPDGSISFALGSYDRTQPLTIDPTLTYSTYLGGNFAEYGFGIAADGAGNFYVTGMTNSSTFPTVNAFQSTNHGIDDVIVAKFNPEGQPVYITYLGGSSIDWGRDIAVDPDGNAYITGYTASTNFPIANAFQPALGGSYDAFVTKLNPAGSALVFSTYFGGSETENSIGSGSGEIAIDSARNVYLTGSTESDNFPTLNAIQPARAGIEDGFVTKFNPTASALIWSTYLGGSINDEPSGIAVDSNGNASITGFTTSGNYPTANAYQATLRGTYDTFVSKINAAGTALVFSTYLGGNDIDYVDKAFDVAVDPAGNVYITGFTGSTNFPIAGLAYQTSYNGGVDAFVSKFSPTGGLSYSTYLGGNWSDDATSIDVNAAGEAFIMGSTQSDNFPTVNPLFPQLRGSEDAFVTRFNAAGSGLIFSTFFGGSNNREMQAPGAIAIGQDNTIYITGNTEASDFPTTANAFQPFRASVHDAFVSRISENSPTATPTSAGPTPTVCALNDYSISQSTGATLVPGTTFVPNSLCNDCTAPMVLPFPVQFYNQTFTQARASSNGNLQFTSDNALPFNSCLPNPEYNNVIYGYWDDLFLDCSGCGIYTSVSGTAPNRIFNIEWRAHRNEPPIVEVNFEIRLYENGNGRFDIVYGQVDNPGDTASVGVQYGTGSRFTQYSCNTGVLSEGLQLSFTLPACNSTPTPGVNTATPTATVSPTPTTPALLYSTYYGSFERDSIDDIAKDAAGNIYVMGTTFQNDIDYGDIWVSKFSPNGQNLLYQRIIGGSRIDYGYALAVDAAGNATVAGIATSFDYPLLNPIQGSHAGGIYDVVMTKLDPAGNTIFSTYLGGNDYDYAERLATDAAGNVYLVGRTDSSNFPTTAGAYQTNNRGSTDGFVTKITPNGSAIVWSTYLGGIYADEVHDIALDSGGNIYLTGFAGSPDFPMVNPFQSTYYDGEAFVTKMNPQGTALIYSTYLGGNNPPGPGEDNGQGITVDAAGYAYVTGYTQSPNFPTTENAYQRFFRGYFDAFVTKLTPAGNALAYSTFVGGTLNPPFGDDEAFDIAIDGAGQAHITGKTNSPDFPVVRAVQPQKADVYDAFVTKLNSSGSDLVYSTFLGGNYNPPDAGGDDAGTSILVDGAGNAVIGGGTDSLDFPTANAFQPEFAGFGDGFISKIAGSNPLASPTPGLTPTATATVPGGVTGTPATATVVVATSTATGAPSTATPGIEPTACALTFTDVPPGSTFYTFVKCLACRGIISGYSDGTFRPNNDITRGQISKIVSQSAGFSEPAGTRIYEDVPEASPFFTWIQRLSNRGLVGGYRCGLVPDEPCVGPSNRPYFRPNAPATRGQLSKIVASAKGITTTPTGQTYQDVPSTHTFYIWIEQLSQLGAMGGYPCGTVPTEPCGAGNKPYFRPANNVTRGQASKIVANTFYPNCQPLRPATLRRLQLPVRSTDAYHMPRRLSNSQGLTGS
jgi:hypothetical protein